MGTQKPDWMAEQVFQDLRRGIRVCGAPDCPDPYCWMDRNEDGEEEPDDLET